MLLSHEYNKQIASFSYFLTVDINYLFNHDKTKAKRFPFTKREKVIFSWIQTWLPTLSIKPHLKSIGMQCLWMHC